ncbi:hypothetical protein ASE67_01400 [Sphingomonas sp. Leaf23]|uniref:hypothetical protein n=1 Tax=Sphingomonas sp. Leaf23 TaxID=1735689 RepID=UPI0006FA46E6|nr:hypothetical protein [Sphingomonas sp. Leaf23]KQM88442.1 hypothetical protein ASE67_01400 [Sphingomonas sp. Leaf23]
MPAAPAKPRRGGWRAQRVVAAMDRLADHIADGGTFPAFAIAEGTSRARPHQLWKMICADLGEQAA